jgi:Ni/Co efflux regulator RcnB
MPHLLACALAALTVATLAQHSGAAPPPQQIAQASSSLHRGDVLPDAYRGQIVSDYERWHLRRPPSGYAWYRVGAQFVMASMATGIIFDIVDANG